MENYIKNNIQGEILIPLETYYKQQEINNKIKPEKIFEYNYKSFRSIVFTNEYLHFFLVILFEKDEENNYNIYEINEFIKNNCYIYISYTKKFQEKEENLDLNKLKDEIYYTLEENKDNKDDIKFINNGTLKQYVILEEKNIIIYELYSKIQLKDSYNNPIINNTKIDLNISLISKKKNNSYDDFDINDIYIINYLSFNPKLEKDNPYSSKSKTLFNINKTLTVINPLKINSMNQYDCGNNKYLLTIKLENITYKLNFLDQTLKNSLILKKYKEIFDEELINDNIYLEFPIIITNIHVDNEKTLINDFLFLNFLKFEQERNIQGKISIDSNGIKYSILNTKFPIVINPKEIYNLVISIEKSFSNYLILESNKKDSNMINQLIKLTISTPIYIYISSDKPINNLIWNFSFKWKDEINNKLNIQFNIGKDDIIIYNFFKVFFTIKKTHKEKIKLEFRFNDSYEDFSLNEKNKANIGDNLPDIFPEKKSFFVELDENEFEKIVEFRYMPIRKEYIEFPPFEIFDIILNKIYLVFFTNKIYVN